MEADIMSEKKCIKVRLTSWERFFALLPMLVGQQWVYRGQEDENWLLVTGLERNEKEIDDYNNKMCPDSAMTRNVKRAINVIRRACTKSPEELDTEKMAIEYFRMMTHGTLKSDVSHVEALATMQHYGCKTRLLDFTFSIFVALFFAYEKRFCGKDRAIWMVNLEELLGDLKHEIYEGILKKNDDVLSEEDQNLIAMYPRQVLLRCSNLADNYLAKENHEELGVCPVWLPGNNPRINAQRGLFLMPKSLRRSFVENLSSQFSVKINDGGTDFEYDEVEFGSDMLKGSSIVKLVLDSSLEERAWEVLSLVNITPEVVYPDLEGLAKSIRYRSGVF